VYPQVRDFILRFNEPAAAGRKTARKTAVAAARKTPVKARATTTARARRK
jgi:hypothetical protein